MKFSTRDFLLLLWLLASLISTSDARPPLFSEGLLATKSSNGKMGYINKSGDWVLPPKVDRAYEFYSGLAKIKNDGKTMFIQKDGSVAFQCEDKYEYGEFSRGICTITIREERSSDEGKKRGVRKVGAVNLNGDIVISPEYERLHLSEGLMKAVKNDKVVFLDKKGIQTIDTIF